MYKYKKKFAICDANVLIDYMTADEDILRETAAYWKGLYVPDCILHEVANLGIERAQELGLVILPTPFTEIQRTSGLSLQDASCLYYVEKESFVCISNDRALRKACQKLGREVIWGLEMILFLIKEKKITKSRGVDIARKITAINPEISEEILINFLHKLEKN